MYVSGWEGYETSCEDCFCGDILEFCRECGPASVKLSSLADSLIKGHLQKPGAAKATLAIFKFNCEKKFEERRIGFAVSSKGVRSLLLAFQGMSLRFQFGTLKSLLTFHVTREGKVNMGRREFDIF